MKSLRVTKQIEVIDHHTLLIWITEDPKVRIALKNIINRIQESTS